MDLPKKPWTAKASGRALSLVSLLTAFQLLAAGVCAQTFSLASEITIAVAGPSAGPHADRSLALWSGADEAVRVLNARGGIKGVPVTLVRADDRCSAESAADVAAELADKRIDLVIGHPCASAAASAANVYGQRVTLFIATSSRHPMLTDRRGAPTIFRISGRDDRQAEAGAAFLLARAPHGRAPHFAIVHDRTRFGRGLGEAVAARLRDATGQAPVIATIIAGEKAFPRTIAKIKDAEAIFFAGFPIEAGLFYQALRKAGGTGDVLFSDSVGSPELAATFGDAVAGALVLRPRFGLHLSADGDADAERLLLDGDRANANAAVMAFADAASRADNLNAASVAAVLNGHALDVGDAARLRFDGSDNPARLRFDGSDNPARLRFDGSDNPARLRFDAMGDAERPSYDVFAWTGRGWAPAAGGHGGNRGPAVVESDKAATALGHASGTERPK